MPCNKLTLAPLIALIRAASSASSDQAATLFPSMAKLIATASIRFRFVTFDLLSRVSGCVVRNSSFDRRFLCRRRDSPLHEGTASALQLNCAYDAHPAEPHH